jgi:hypothetical protein
MMPENMSRKVVSSRRRSHPIEEEANVPKKNDHKHTPQEERWIREAAMDETLEATFPASDPPSTIPNPHEDEALERARKRGKK